MSRFLTAATLLFGSASALRLTRGEALRSLSSTAAAASAYGIAPAVFADAPGGIMPTFDADGKLVESQGYSEETIFRTLRNAETGGSVKMLDAWKATDGGGFTDPVLGTATDLLQMTSAPTSQPTTADLGKPERIKLVETFGLEKELLRADLVAAAVRRTPDGLTFYDFDLALPAKKCDFELATACLPTKVVLLSCGVKAGALHLMRVDADAAQWKRNGRELRNLRSSFEVA